MRINASVHYTSHGTPVRPDGTQAFAPRCRVAIVTEVSETDPNHVGLMVINPTGLFFHSLADGGCHYGHPGNAVSVAAGGAGGTWHWEGNCINR